MKKQLGLFIVLLMVVPVVLWGCGGGGNSDPAPVILLEENFSTYAQDEPLSGVWTKMDGTTATGCLIKESIKAVYLDVTNNTAVYNTSAAVN